MTPPQSFHEGCHDADWDGQDRSTSQAINAQPSTAQQKPYTGPERRSSMRVWQDKVDRRFQARAALHNAGLFPAVEALMAHEDTPMIVKLAWTDAQEFRRTSPTVQALAGAMNLTDEQVDALFVAAAGIEA